MADSLSTFHFPLYTTLMDYTFLKSAFGMAKIACKENEPLAPKTTFKVGGNAALFVIPQNISQLQSAIGGAAASDLPFFVLGGGSNVVFPDGLFDSVVISTQELNNITMTDEQPKNLPPDSVLVTCQAGTPTATFVNFCTKHNLSGAQQFAGLPGTIGGAAYMNARCFERSISDILYETEHIDFSKPTQTKLVTMPFKASDWDYKKSPFQNQKKLITAVTFCLTKLPDQNHTKLEEECKKYISERIEKGHFKFPSAGSVFKNNHDFGKPSGKIIDEAGLRGYQIGGAQVAPFHGNFIINIGNAKASEIKQLVEYVQTQVETKFGHHLEPEIILL